jgi:signal transduction histidine kinase
VNASLKLPVLGRWDRLRRDRVVTNLVSNAIKYGGAQPIDSSLTANDGGAVLVVRVPLPREGPTKNPWPGPT